jgi:2-C-methyl-D-erythritol 2,4-cyclodiphosphate synthase
MRIGYGYDAHRLVRGRPCILCGVTVPGEFGPDGHSDADAPLHALIDALLGAVALGDIGTHFPDSDARFEGASSVELLRSAYALVVARGYRICNADLTIVLQAPKIAEYVGAMRENISHALGCEYDEVSVKATTEERMGFTGDGTGLSAHAAVLVEHI